MFSQKRCGVVWYVPRSGFIHEWQRDALQGGRTRRHDKFSTDALCELALYARLFASVAGRVRGQALELPIQQLCILAVFQRECRAALVVIPGYGMGRDRRDQRDGKGDL